MSNISQLSLKYNTIKELVKSLNMSLLILKKSSIDGSSVSKEKVQSAQAEIIEFLTLVRAIVNEDENPKNWPDSLISEFTKLATMTSHFDSKLSMTIDSISSLSNLTDEFFSFIELFLNKVDKERNIVYKKLKNRRR